MSGLLLIVPGTTGTGTAVKLIPRPIVVGPDTIREGVLDARV